MAVETKRTWKYLVEILEELRPALRAIDFESLPKLISTVKTDSGFAELTGLKNDHLGGDHLILPELPENAVIPRNYKGFVSYSRIGLKAPMPGMRGELQTVAPIGDDPILKSFAECVIYQNPR